ncbi:MAG: tetratricopeptide repeat protein [Bryobacterales bacterium]|nr:tetratricopeptide repeat protein [Bryobacterales bacterium]
MNKHTVGMLTLFLFATSLSAQEAASSKGIEQYESRDYAEAEKSLRAAMEAEPEDWRSPYYLGLTLLKLQKPAEAMEAFQQAEKKTDANVADVKVGMAQAMVAQKDYTQADRVLNEAASLDEGNKELPYARGLLMLARKEFANSAKHFETAISRNSKHAYAHYYAGMAYNGMKRPDRMVEHFEAFLKLAPDAPEASKVQSVLRSVR